MFGDTITYPHIGHIRRDSPALDRLIAPDTPIEMLEDGFIWTEGPVWISEGRWLFFSDVPANRMYRWSEQSGATLYLSPSGNEGADLLAFREPGSNGLIRGPGYSLLMADQGNRAVAAFDLDTRTKTLLATEYQGKKFNSPNDLVRASSGTIYFTDPPYGLEGLNASPLKELPFNGVYRLDVDGTVTLLESGLSFPNGIVISPDGHILYVSNSDPRRAVIMAYMLDPAGGIAGRRIFADVTSLVGDDRPGLPDGMAVDVEGNVFATGPGGILIFNRDGAMLGLIATGNAVANCTFGDDGSTLYIASHRAIARVRTQTVGLGF